MAWETRGSGRYYYRKVRWNGGVQSQYVGTGPLADAVAVLDEIEQRELQSRRQAWRTMVKEERVVEKDLDQAEGILRTLTTAVLLINGCYIHKRQWRRCALERPSIQVNEGR
jgi:hypothetical protein